MKTKKLHEAAYTCAAFTDAWRTFTTEKTVKNAQDLVAKGSGIFGNSEVHRDSNVP